MVTPPPSCVRPPLSSTLTVTVPADELVPVIVTEDVVPALDADEVVFVCEEDDDVEETVLPAEEVADDGLPKGMGIS